MLTSWHLHWGTSSTPPKIIISISGISRDKTMDDKLMCKLRLNKKKNLYLLANDCEIVIIKSELWFYSKVKRA